MIQKISSAVAGTVGRESDVIRKLRPTYENALNWLSGNQGVEWELNQEPFRIDARHRMRMSKDYDRPVAEYFRKHVKPGDVCFDIGANVGIYVLQFSRWSGPEGKVVAFEPNPSTLEALRHHVAINSIGKQVTVVPAAVGATPGEANLYAAEFDGMSRLGEVNRQLAEVAKPVTVPVTTVDVWSAENNMFPNVMLVDVEGFEIAVLEGARETIARQGQSLTILVEMHPDVWDSAGTNRAAAERILAELDLTPHGLMGQKDPLAEHGTVVLSRR